jgi:serine/threonine protein kinase
MWKIADFGLTVPGTSTGNNYTKHSRGTVSYRAPEMIQGDHGTWNNKVDIWALGCIFYELITSERAFLGDFGIEQHAERFRLYPNRLQNVRWPPIDARSKTIVSGMVHAMLMPNNWDRPRTVYLLGVLSELEKDASSVWLSGCRHAPQVVRNLGVGLPAAMAGQVSGKRTCR